jgi:flavin-dependent dehydrogenase
VTPEATFDVVVVGGGGSGLAAAIEARASGRDVVLIEKNPQLGGSTGQGGLLLKGHGHHLGWAFASGRRAGRNAASFEFHSIN